MPQHATRLEAEIPGWEAVVPIAGTTIPHETWRRAASRGEGTNAVVNLYPAHADAHVPSPCHKVLCRVCGQALCSPLLGVGLQRLDHRPCSVDDRPRDVLSSRLAPPTRPCVCRQQIVSMAVGETCWTGFAAVRAVSHCLTPSLASAYLCPYPNPAHPQLYPADRFLHPCPRHLPK